MRNKDMKRAMCCKRIKNSKVMLLAMLSLAGCSSIETSVSEQLAQSLSAGISNQTDVELVKSGIPSYLLMIDGMIVEDPANQNLYLAGAKLYSAIANFTQGDPQRLMLLTDKAHQYSEKALCLRDEEWCGISQHSFDEYRKVIGHMSTDEVDVLYLYGTTWASRIEAHRNDMNAVADLPKVKATMNRVLEMDEQYDRGGAHLYLAVMESLVPPALGGRPDTARAHFERVIEITRGRYLMAKVMYAEHYARMLFNRDLHDQLLKDVLAQDPVEEGFTLANVVAQRKAKRLLQSAEDYF